MSKKIVTLIIAIVILAIGAFYYWFFIRNASPAISTDNGTTSSNGFSPFSSGQPVKTGGNTNTNSQVTSVATTSQGTVSLPVLRKLSATPVGGFTASSTGSTTLVRWIDRGTGKVYQANSNDLTIAKLSNTTVPMVYESYWNKKASAFIFRSLQDDSDTITTFYTELRVIQVASSTASSSVTASSIPFELRGSPLPSDTALLAVAPKGDRVFTFTNDNGTGSGYVSDFNGSKKTLVFTTPITQINTEWPEDNTITLTTKGSSFGVGFLYFVNPKDGIFNKIIGGVRGLSTLVSHDAKKVLYSTSSGTSFSSAVFDIKTQKSQDLAFNTLPEKCVWSSLKKDVIFCSVPSQITPASYPEDWYQGKVSFSDKIWQVNVTTGEAHLMAELLNTSGEIIDAENLTLDPKENYLYFMNKRDLSLWSLSLNNS
jgi:hypothetical protein